MSKHEVGDLVQFFQDSVLMDGEVIGVTLPTKPRPERYWEASKEEQKEFNTYLTIRLEDGSEVSVDASYVSDRDDEYQRAFRTTCDEVQAKIYDKCAQAEALLYEAVKLSEEHGIPFSPGISPLGQSYMPGSMRDKFPEVEREFMREVSDSYGEYDGWQHSAVCY